MAKRERKAAEKKASKKQAANKGKELPGVSLEKAVASIQQMMDPSSIVTRNEWLIDRVGNRRQYDVVVRGTFGGRPVLGIIECKDHKRKKGPAAVEAFAKKCDHVGANLRLMVSRVGFTKQALKLAEHEHVGCLSLVPHDPDQVGWGIGSFVYAKVGSWTDIRLSLGFPDSPSPISQEVATKLTIEAASWQGLPVIRWFVRELYTNHSEEKQPGTYRFNLVFSRVQMLEIAGQEYPVKGLTCEAQWVFRKKRTWARWSGEAFYDWNENKIMVPGGVTITVGPVSPDLRVWDDYDGDLPVQPDDLKGKSMALIFVFGQHWPDDVLVPDLSSFGPLKVSGPRVSI